jgi:protoporphyrinogen oxidase
LKVAVIGGGVAGLTAAYELSKAGQEVVLFEKERELGGLASSFPLSGHHIERYYHFICLNDSDLLDMLRELGLDSRLRWAKTRMGLYHKGRLYSFGAPLDLLTFTPFSLVDRLRFGLMIMYTKSQRRGGWRSIEDVPVAQWLVRRFGQKSYEVIHEPLIRLKFGPYAAWLSAAWMWARIHRLGKSRTKITQQEKLGYIEGETKTLIDALERRFLRNGGRVFRGVAAQEIEVREAGVTTISYNGQRRAFDAVISTVPTPAFAAMLNGASPEYLQKIARIDSIGVMCVLLRLIKSLTPYFWTNISDPAIPLAGVIEYTNLNPCPHFGGDSIIYLPQYLPSTDERYAMSDDRLLEEYIGYLKRINPGFSEDWIREYYVSRDRYAQPVCEVGFSKYKPGIETPVKGLYLTDSCQLHPDDRTVSNSIGLGKRVAQLVLDSKRAEG